MKGEEKTKLLKQKAETNWPLLKDEQARIKQADLFKTLGDETRLQINGMLSIADLCMCEIVSGLNIPNSTVTHHLKLLERGRVVTTRKGGCYTIYQLNDQMELFLSVNGKEAN